MKPITMTTGNGVIRDSDACVKRRVRVKGNGKPKKKDNRKMPSSKRAHRDLSRWSMPSGTHSMGRVRVRTPKPSRANLLKQSQDGIDSRSEAAFRDWWMESKGKSLQPRSETLPTAKQRIEALHLRVLSRG